MKSNVNVFVGVVLCAILCGMFVWLRSAGEEDTWKPNEIYDQVHSSSYGASYTNATFSASPQEGGLAVSMSSPSSMRARHATNFYAGAHTGIATMPLASSPMGAASGAGLYATSSAELKSFGGGGNGGTAMGGAARGNSVSSASLQGGAGIGFVSSPIAYSTAHRGDISSTSGTNPAMMAVENPVVAAMGVANAANGIYGAYSVMDYSASGNYNQYTSMFGGGRMGVRGRQNLGIDDENVEDSWLTWLAMMGTQYGHQENGVWVYDVYELKEAYDAFCASWNSGMGKKPTWDEWLAWFMRSEGNPYMWGEGENQYSFSYVPVGDFMPLIVFAFLYVVFVVYRRRQCKMINSGEDVE